jgi:BirA family transcriptional regulator, biotin operon repressor / biotin---[acetyl-CoA-carboxylase] ligase
MAGDESSAGGTARIVSGWSIEHRDRVDTTQTLARGRPAWSAVVAGEQTAGRGQATRSFTSDPGGLYVTAVLPYAGDPLETRGFALAVGWALRASLQGMGMKELRLRWPNDLMVGSRKVGGILVEQGGPESLLVGVGLNVTNRPWLAEPSLQGIAGRLADAMVGCALPEIAEVTSAVLQAIRTAHETFARDRLAGFVARLNDCWGPAQEVVLEPAGGVQRASVQGWFRGIDRDGRVLVQLAEGKTVAIPAHEIGRLREGMSASRGL